MLSPGGTSGGDLFSKPNGTYTYPTRPRLRRERGRPRRTAGQAAADATAFRITLNTLENPNLVATAIAIGGTPGVTHPSRSAPT